MKAFGFLFIIGLLLSACQTVKGQSQPIKCPDTVVINSFITTFGFDYSDLDTAKIILYKKGSKFKMKVDSFFVIQKDVLTDSINKTRYIDVGEVKQITNQVDWVLFLKKKRVYQISDVATNIIIERHQFKRCKMTSFKLNGKKTVSSQIEIVKPGFKKKRLPPLDATQKQKNRQRMIL